MLWISGNIVTMKSNGQCYHEQNLVTKRRYLFLTSKSQPWEQRSKSLNCASIPRFVELHPHSVIPPDIQTCRAFLEWVAKGKDGRIEERPTVGTMKGFFRQFVTGMKRERNFDFPPTTRTTIKEVCTAVFLNKSGLIPDSISREN